MCISKCTYSNAWVCIVYNGLYLYILISICVYCTYGVYCLYWQVFDCISTYLHVMCIGMYGMYWYLHLHVIEQIAHIDKYWLPLVGTWLFSCVLVLLTVYWYFLACIVCKVFVCRYLSVYSVHWRTTCHYNYEVAEPRMSSLQDLNLPRAVNKNVDYLYIARLGAKRDFEVWTCDSDLGLIF